MSLNSSLIHGFTCTEKQNLYSEADEGNLRLLVPHDFAKHSLIECFCFICVVQVIILSSIRFFLPLC